MRAPANAVQHDFTSVLRVAEKRCISDAASTNNMVQLQRMKKKGKGKVSYSIN